MSTENEKIRIIDLDSGDSSVSMTDTNNALMVDSNSTGIKKLSLFAILEKIIAYIKGRPSRVLPDSNPNQVLSTDENNNVVWKEPTAQVNADWTSTRGVSQILHKPDLSVYATTDALDTARTTLSNSINEEVSDRMTDVSSLRSDLTSESSTRSEADANINASLTAEIDARTSGDATLQSALETKANASELSVTPGTGANADKTTIQLKDGVSATVLTAHQAIPEQKQADWNESDSSKLDFIKNKPTNLSDFTNDLGFITDASIEGKANKSEMSITAGTGNATIQLKTGTSATVLTQHQDISDKADKATTYTKTEVDTALSGKAAVDHNHDDRYYTESEVDTALTNKADKATTLAGYGITDAKIASGTITLGSQTITPVVASDIEGKAEKSELSVTPGTGADADKTTIQLKTGTSATVLTAHQAIPEQKQTDWNESDSSKVTFIKNKPTTLSGFTNDAGFITSNDITGKAEKSEMAVADVSGDNTKKTITLKNGLSVDVVVNHKEELPEVGTNQNRGKVLSVNNSDELVWSNSSSNVAFFDGKIDFTANPVSYSQMPDASLVKAAVLEGKVPVLRLLDKDDHPTFYYYVGLHGSDANYMHFIGFPRYNFNNTWLQSIFTVGGAPSDPPSWMNSPYLKSNWPLNSNGSPTGNAGDVLTIAQNGYEMTWAPAGGGGGGGGSQIIIDYDISDDTATYNGSSIAGDTLIEMAKSNPNIGINIYETYEGTKYVVGYATLSRVYEDQGLYFSMQQFSSDGMVEKYLTIVASEPDSEHPNGWTHNENYP